MKSLTAVHLPHSQTSIPSQAGLLYLGLKSDTLPCVQHQNYHVPLVPRHEAFWLSTLQPFQNCSTGPRVEQHRLLCACSLAFLLLPGQHAFGMVIL